jgi:hypothetical protein
LQMTHSIDSFITDSANSATALYTGKKSTVNALNVYVDSVGILLHFSVTQCRPEVSLNLSPLLLLVSRCFRRPKGRVHCRVVQEEDWRTHWYSLYCVHRRCYSRFVYYRFGLEAYGLIFISAALCSHTRDRDQYASVVYEYLYNATALTPQYTWPTSCKGPDVIFG